MNKEDNKFEILKSLFQEEVLNPIIKTNHLNSRFLGNAENRNYTSLSLCSCNKHYKESDYYIDQENTFIHFSSIKKAQSILEHGEIRLYHLSHQNDNREYRFAAEILGENPRACDKLRRGMYSLSMCKTEIENDLTLWRLYADNTKGIGFIFRITNNPIFWMHYHLSKIYYGEIDKLNIYKKSKTDFEKKYKFRFNLGLHRFLGFHKSDDFSVEKEVRLIYIHEETTNPFSFFPTLVDTNNLPEYVSIKLNNNLYSPKTKICELRKPIIEIKEIVLGPNFKNEAIVELIQEKYQNVSIRKSKFEGSYKVK